MAALREIIPILMQNCDLSLKDVTKEIEAVSIRCMMTSE